MIQPVRVTVQMATVGLPVEVSVRHGVQQMSCIHVRGVNAQHCDTA